MTRLLALTSLLLLLTAAPASAALKFEPSCGGNLECAQLRVPLDRSGGVPGTIRLSIERVRAQGRKHEGAVFALAGGPGQAGSSVSENFANDVFGAIGTRDLIVVDQRGTGRSGALDCKALEQPDDRPIDVRTAECAAKLGARRGFYTTADSVADLEAVRRELGVERITLLGVSYGTKVALTYAATYPQHVEKLVLDSVVEPQGQSPFDLDTFAAMPRVFAEMCRGECAGVTDDLAADVAALADRMPLRGPLVDPRGRRLQRSITARDLYQQIRAGDTFADFRVGYPGAVRAALDGDPAPLVRLLRGGELLASDEPQPSFAQTLSFTLQAATLCEEAPLPWERTATPEQRDASAAAAAAAIPDTAFEPFSRDVALARDSNSLLFQCRRWPTTPARAAAPGLDAMPDVPVLVMEGLEDLRTPLEIGERVAAAFPRAQVLEVAKTGHSVLGGAVCARAALKRFMAGGNVGSPCEDVRRGVRILPVPPAALDDVPGGSRAKRTIAAARLTLADLEALLLTGTDRGGGLRGGTFVRRGREYVLTGFSYVPGVEVSGRVSVLGKRSGPLRVRGGGAAPVVLRLRDGRLRRVR